jgi:hypothetical protein
VMPVPVPVPVLPARLGNPQNYRCLKVYLLLDKLKYVIFI